MNFRSNTCGYQICFLTRSRTSNPEHEKLAEVRVVPWVVEVVSNVIDTSRYSTDNYFAGRGGPNRGTCSSHPLFMSYSLISRPRWSWHWAYPWWQRARPRNVVVTSSGELEQFLSYQLYLRFNHVDVAISQFVCTTYRPRSNCAVPTLTNPLACSLFARLSLRCFSFPFNMILSIGVSLPHSCQSRWTRYYNL